VHTEIGQIIVAQVSKEGSPNCSRLTGYCSWRWSVRLSPGQPAQAVPARVRELGF